MQGGSDMAKRQYDPRKCLMCDFTFIPKKSWQKFCNPKCHNKYWVARRSNPDDRFVKFEGRLNVFEGRLAAFDEFVKKHTVKP